MNHLVIDSTGCPTTLCSLCAQAGTDKSPYSSGHRHPYTAPYSLFFEPLRHKPIKLAEVGVFRGASLQVWRSFFSKAHIYGFDRDEDFLKFIRSIGMPGVTLDTMDASQRDLIAEKLKKHTEDGELFDVIIDDASHDPGHQSEMIRAAMPFLKQGGLLIIEDIFRDRTEGPLVEAYEEIKEMVSFQTFILCEHVNRYSPGWNNDKMLVLVRA